MPGAVVAVLKYGFRCRFIPDGLYSHSMSTPLLAAQLFVPLHGPHAVSRLRLITRLDEGLSRKVTLACALAGFGKWSLLSEWAASSSHACASVSLDARDNDLHQFLSYNYQVAQPKHFRQVAG